jgi:SAM-dependent methyltransferase
MTGTTTGSTWAAGDYPAMARLLRPAADQVVAIAAPGPGTSLLDIGCGTGNAALAAARLGAVVTGADPTPELLSVAAGRARDEGLEITWQQADTLGLTGEYDRVVSVFGAMYAPDARQAADAMLRRCAPGGRIVSAAWTPDGFMAETNRVIGAYLPPALPGARPPTGWGDPAHLAALFAPHQVTTSAHSVRFRFASPIEAAEFWIRTAGHVQAERHRIEARGDWTALHHDLAALFSERNPTPAHEPGVHVAADYLVAVVTPS